MPVAEEPDEVCADVGEEEPSILPLPHLSNTAATRLPYNHASDGGSSREATGAPSPAVEGEGEGEGEGEERDEWLADLGEVETPISHPLCSSSTFSIATRDVAGSTADDSKSQQGLSVGEPCVGSNTADEPRGVCSPSPSPGNRQPEEPQTEGQGHFGDHYAVFDKVGNGKELEDVIFDSTCGSDDYGAVVGVNVLLCMLGLHALGVTHNDYHYGNLLVADEATGGLKVIDLESLRKVVWARHPTAKCREDGTPGPQPPTRFLSLQSHPAPPNLSLHHLQTWARGDGYEWGYDVKEVSDYTPATFAVNEERKLPVSAGHLRHFATDKLQAVLHHFRHLAEADLGDEAARRAVGMYQRAVADIRQEARRLSTTERQERAVALWAECCSSDDKGRPPEPSVLKQLVRQYCDETIADVCVSVRVEAYLQMARAY
ncbi:unnamed protein product [Vitrella brassicaformis CCMP3155]|uniref:Protein kinase domain-containing protein n=1 Tax=Vitrella brassicaformis (strain CCMP3155) TaxID=1169540 RepID=A0A0G4FZZ3_VITBC|nr:unnamed protein product [Vitrella brassicaformis CCMP3155]|eukprot:CEM20976.1 unnamed protein product [Vitrella brassicaformis CCMP3155]